MAIDQGSVVVGAQNRDTAAGREAGAAYVFVPSGPTWVQQAELLPSDGSAGDSFGNAVDISGDTVLVGAEFDAVQGGAYAGSAYVFQRSGSVWVEQAKLVASDRHADDRLGTTVTLQGGTAVVGGLQLQGGQIRGGGTTGRRWGWTAPRCWRAREKTTAAPGTPTGASRHAAGRALAASALASAALRGRVLSVVREVHIDRLEPLVLLGRGVLGVGPLVGTGQVDAVGERSEQRSRIQPLGLHGIDLHADDQRNRAHVDPRHQPEHQGEHAVGVTRVANDVVDVRHPRGLQ
ncbi:MAG: FG-GAP repeat protein [Geodermatophilaceae bacterium]|nr:FG-GAP repeat protein [Geodermatophilaceae bacterium]